MKRTVIYFLLLLMSCYVLLVTQLLWKDRNVEREKIPEFDHAHFARDRKKRILYHHRGHKAQIPNHLIASISAKMPRADQAARMFIDNLDVRPVQVMDKTAWNLSYEWTKQALDGIPRLEYMMSHLEDTPVESVNIVTKADSWRQIRLVLRGNQIVNFVPKFYDIDYVVLGAPESTRERHYSHILAYHLSRLLGFSNIPVAKGRRFNVTKHLTSIGSADFLSHVFNFDGRTCISLECPRCTNLARSVCSEVSGEIEGALLFLPQDTNHTSRIRHNPWQYNLLTGLSKVKVKRLCGNTSDPTELAYLLEVVDATIFDFLMDNRDRPDFTLAKDHTIRNFDSGFGLGNPYMDNVNRLSPLETCCRIKDTTFRQLQHLNDGVLSRALALSVTSDPLSPLTTEATLTAFNRRLTNILNYVRRCVTLHGVSRVITSL